MAKIVLISCGKEKRCCKSKSQDLYKGALFRKSLQYARSLGPDAIYILSAKYGLLRLDDEIEPYDKTLDKMRSNEIKQWADSVLKKLRRLTDVESDEFVILAGDKYRKELLLHLHHYSIPMKGLRIGEQGQWLNAQILRSSDSSTI